MLDAVAGRPPYKGRDSAFPFQSIGSPQRLFPSPAAAGRRITAGFSYIQRIGKSAAIDVWFPDALKRRIDAMMEQGLQPGPAEFPAQWAALRQFELLQEGGNYKIYDLDASHITRSMVHLARDMRAGGYRVTIASLGSYDEGAAQDDLHILDLRLQDRLSNLIHMLYLEEESVRRTATQRQALDAGNWDLGTALPHIGATLGARDLFGTNARQVRQGVSIPAAPHMIQIAGWLSDLGVSDAETHKSFQRVLTAPRPGQYRMADKAYEFAATDCGHDIVLRFTSSAAGHRLADSVKDRRHRLARQFFDILSVLPAQHIVHDTAIGLQLPEAIAENEWIYLSPADETLGAFNRLLGDLFSPFDRLSLGSLQGRADAAPEYKSSVNHLRGTGDRLTAGADAFYRGLAQYAL